MKVLSKFFMLSSVMLALVFASCSGDDGTDGLDGADGVDGVDGAQGIPGLNGTNGTDGNANAQVLFYDTTTLAGAVFSIDVPEFTEQLLMQSTILVYTQIYTGEYFQVPGAIGLAEITSGAVLDIEKANIYFYSNVNGNPIEITDGDILAIKIVIIDSSSFINRVASKSATAKDVLSVLKADGVDVNDYEAVAAYFNL
tara:strand:+ start:4122 stop:4715 length:594 start_codon:yes stop_codon:yes gene_type:complete